MSNALIRTGLTLAGTIAGAAIGGPAGSAAVGAFIGGTGITNIYTGGVYSATSKYQYNLAGGSSVVNLYGGLMDVGEVAEWGNGTIDITGGTLMINGAVSDAYATPAGILAYGGGGTLQFSYDSDNNETAITAIPEPATIALLGLGGLALLRKRR